MKDKVLACVLSLGLLLGLGLSEITAQNQFEVLVYSQYSTYHKEAIPAAINAFKTMAQKHQFGLNWTQDAGIFASEELDDFAAVVFLDANGNAFTEEQRVGLERYINQGGGFVGLHAASTTNEEWAWYDQLVGRVFTGHPVIQTAVLQVVDAQFPAARHLPSTWIWTDEWYNFGEPKSDHLRVVLKVDESTYDPRAGYGDPIMGAFHPISWYQEFDGGRSFYHALGHKPDAYQDQRNLDLIYGGIYWAATGRGISTK